MLEKLKLALRISSDTVDFDSELEDLIQAGLGDLGLAGVLSKDNQEDPLVVRAVITYSKIHWGDSSGTDYDRLKDSYNEQKSQLMMATGFTDWGDGDEQK